MMKKRALPIVVIMFFSIWIVAIYASNGKGGNPFDEIWSKINNIEGRVNILENTIFPLHNTYVKEYLLNQEVIAETEYQKVATFIITPKNPENNALLDLWFNYKYKADLDSDFNQLGLRIIIKTNLDPEGKNLEYSYNLYDDVTNYIQSKVYRWVGDESSSGKIGSYLIPNQEYYEVEVWIRATGQGTTSKISLFYLIYLIYSL